MYTCPRLQFKMHCSLWVTVKRHRENCHSIDDFVSSTVPRTPPTFPSASLHLSGYSCPSASPPEQPLPSEAYPGFPKQRPLPAASWLFHAWHTTRKCRWIVSYLLGGICLGLDPSLPLTRCVTEGKSLVLSMPQFPYLQRKADNNNNTSLRGLS